MTDIVDRLRGPEVFLTEGTMISPVAYDAASEIERLRSLLTQWAALDAGSWNVNRHAREKAELLAETRAYLNLTE